VKGTKTLIRALIRPLTRPNARRGAPSGRVLLLALPPHRPAHPLPCSTSSPATSPHRWGSAKGGSCAVEPASAGNWEPRPGHAATPRSSGPARRDGRRCGDYRPYWLTADHAKINRYEMGSREAHASRCGTTALLEWW